MKYDLKALAGKPKSKRKQVKLPVIQESLAAERSYLRILRAMIREMRAFVNQDLLPQAIREAQTKDGLTRDMDQSNFDRWLALSTRLRMIAEASIREILSAESVRHTDKFKAAIRRSMGIDLSALIGREDLTDYMQTAVARNVGLIRGLADDVGRRVQNRVTTAVINGQSAKELREQLAKEFKMSDNRARLIARDQIAKLNSDLNRERQTQAGVQRYEWVTSQDERVRPLHQELDGRVYEYGKPTDAEEGLPPGQPINCRCIARGIVEF